MTKIGTKQLLALLYSEASGQNALGYVRRLWESDRWSNFANFALTAQTVESLFFEIGLSDIQRVEKPADGKYRVGDWIMPLAWDCYDATLEIAWPPTDKPLIARRLDQPNHVGMWSAPTPKNGIEADLVILEQGTPEEVRSKRDQIRGKWVLTYQQARNIKSAVIEAGGAGLITCWTRNPDLLDAVPWVNGWSDRPGGWVYTANDRPLPCFAISKRQANHLRHLLLQHGQVRLRGRIDARFYEGHLDYVTARIPGTDLPEEEVIVLGHLYEQGANDNCSGCAAIIEMARTLARLIRSGRLPAPRRSIRFLLMAECYGSLAYAQDNRTRMAKTLVCSCIDTGAGRVESSNARYQICVAPLCSRSFYEAVHCRTVTEYLRAYRPARTLKVIPFACGTDQLYNDPAIGVPTHWSSIGTDFDVWHCSADDLKRVDERAYVDLVCAEGATLYRVANADENDAALFAKLTAIDAKKHILDLLAEGKSEWIIRVHGRAQVSAIMSATRLAEHIGMAEQLARQFEDFLEREIESARSAGMLEPIPMEVPNPDAPQWDLVPAREPWHIGSASLDPVPRQDWAEAGITRAPRWGGPHTLALWWADGKRTIRQIYENVAAETDPAGCDLIAWFRLLEKHGYVTLQHAQ